MKRPAFQFYPGDWQHDAALRSCSVGARGLWIEMICIMHQAEPYGYLKVNHNPILPPILARMVGASEIEVQGWLDELSTAGVSRQDEDGIFSRRMVKDEKLRAIRAEGGKLGGNPALLDKSKVDNKVNHKAESKVNMKPTPSSSSSSSSSKQVKAAPSKLGFGDLVIIGVDEQIAKDWLTVRKVPLTTTSMRGIENEAKKAGISVAEAITICATQGWRSFKASWNWKDVYAPITKIDTSCTISVAGQPCGMPGELDFNGRTYICPHHREKRLEASKAPMPEATRKKLKDAGMLTR